MLPRTFNQSKNSSDSEPQSPKKLPHLLYNSILPLPSVVQRAQRQQQLSAQRGHDALEAGHGSQRAARGADLCDKGLPGRSELWQEWMEMEQTWRTSCWEVRVCKRGYTFEQSSMGLFPRWLWLKNRALLGIENMAI